MTGLDRITVRGFKSIRALENFELRPLNVLIGANGAGKSNFISLFRMLAELVEGRLQLYVQTHGGPDALLFGTRKRTAEMSVEVRAGPGGYRISLVPAGGRLISSREEADIVADGPTTLILGGGYDEARIAVDEGGGRVGWILPALAGRRVYHFHDTSDLAPVRNARELRDNLRLKSDAGNLAPFLRFLREHHPPHYRRIVETVRTVAPYFSDFVHRENPGERVELEWFQVDDLETPLGPLQLSDGTLRFICLATLLLQPVEMQPETILIEEPELGLHPFAINIVASLLQRTSEQRQIIVSTQSAELLNQLEPEEIVVVDRESADASVFKRLDAEPLSEWLEDYALGELWKMNVVGADPSVSEIAIVCEGQTEQTFVAEVLAPVLGGEGVFARARVIPTSQYVKGGALSRDRVVRGLRNTLRERGDLYVTTFFDLYGLQSEFPGVREAGALKDALERAALVEARLGEEVVREAGCREERFIPYIQPYEFEALLFSELNRLAEYEPAWQRSLPELRAARSGAPSPEHINDGPMTHPSARLEGTLVPRYRKVPDGSAILKLIGIERLRQECAHFGAWLDRLLALS